MERKKIFAFVLPLSLFLLSCASDQAPKQVLLGTERVVELYVPGCGG
jgi:PBP1b-binding outer membrane lipoprotein LpoB